MAGSSLLAVGSAAVVALGCLGAAALVLRDPAARDMLGRIRTLNEAAAAPAKAAPRPRDIRRTDNAQDPLSRLLGRLGRSPHLPQEWRVAWPVLSVLALAAALGGAYVAAIVLGGLFAPFAAVAAGVGTVHFLFRWELQRYRQKVFLQIPEAMGLILRAIRAGLPMAEALTNVAREIASPSREEFVRVAGEISIGRPVEAGLFGLADRTGLTEYFFFAVTVGLQAQTGGSLGETLENLAEMVRKRVSLAAKVKAMTAEARMSAIILTALPFCVGGVLAVAAPDHFRPLFETELGFQLLLVGGVLLLIGVLAIRGLIRSAAKD